MLKDITFGQYYSTVSVLHKADPRSKFISLILLIVFLLLCNNVYSLLFAVLSVITILFISKVPISLYLKNLKSILPIIIFTAIINVFYNTEGNVLLSYWKITVTTGGIYKSIYMALRIIMLIFVSSVLTYTTTPNDLTDGIERLLSPLRVFGLQNAVHVLVMMMTIALRFIPTLVDETEKIINAQKARGADIENGKLMERIKALIPILIPLFITSVRHSYELAEAMESRCYNGGVGRKRMKQLKYTKYDLFVFVGTIIICALIVIFIIFMG